jgi:hypothetical protein
MLSIILMALGLSCLLLACILAIAQSNKERDAAFKKALAIYIREKYNL